MARTDFEERRILGLRLTTERVRQRQTQAQAGELAGITQASLSNYEAGKRDVPLYVVRRLAAVWGVSLAELVEGTPP
jgi:transcriptional regulator with XRE-family HTH domain